MASSDGDRAPFLHDYGGEDEDISSHGSEVDDSGSRSHKPRGLAKRLTQLDGISITVGVVVGSGIFASPGIALDQVGAVGTFLVLWVIGGTLAYISSLCYAELGSCMPSAGGDVEFLHRAFGGAAAFAITWAMFFVISGGGIAIVALTFSRYFVSTIFDYEMGKDLDEDWTAKGIAITSVVLLTTVNCTGVKRGSIVQNVLSFSKVLLVGGAVAAAIVAVIKDPSIAWRNTRNAFKGTCFRGLGPGLVTILWAFDGWNALAFMGEEMINTEQDLPRGIGFGMLFVILIYLAMNVSYLCILPARDLVRSRVVAEDTVEAVFGMWAGRVMAFFVDATVLGCANGSIMIGGRYLFASARIGLFPEIFNRISEPDGTPYSALMLQGLWVSIILLLPGTTLNKLISYFGVAAWIFYGANAAALIRLRSQCPDLHRPYRVPFFPFTPLVLIAIALYMVASSVVADPVPSLTAFTFVALSYPVYRRFFRKEQRQGDASER